MTTGSALYIPPYKADDQDVVVELNTRFGPEAFTAQATRTYRRRRPRLYGHHVRHCLLR